MVTPRLCAALGIPVLGLLLPASAARVAPQPAPNSSGVALTHSRQGKIDTTNPFFQSLGTNGRSCNSCHVESAGWSLTPAEIEARFDATAGMDPLFRTNDGSTWPGADVSTVEARREAYKLLRTRGLIRVGLPIPAGAEFALETVDDPYGYASAAELSMYRRPLPAANLKFIGTVMWDGRNSKPGQKLAQNLADQASGATTGHAAAGAAPTKKVLDQIVRFESALFTAQVTDNTAGPLNTRGAKGGPVRLSATAYRDGINNPFATRRPFFNREAFTLFKTFARTPRGVPAEQVPAREAIARGEAVFNNKPFVVTDVPGLNDVRNLPSLSLTCTKCHNTPNVGSNSLGEFMDIGVSTAERRTADVPLYTLRRLSDGALRQTTDPGRALVTGKWADIGKFKMAPLRGLASRPPYFHNGSAATLEEVVEFYDTRFSINFSQQQKQDLVAFLKSL